MYCIVNIDRCIYHFENNCSDSCTCAFFVVPLSPIGDEELRQQVVRSTKNTKYKRNINPIKNLKHYGKLQRIRLGKHQRDVC